MLPKLSGVVFCLNHCRADIRSVTAALQLDSKTKLSLFDDEIRTDSGNSPTEFWMVEPSGKQVPSLSNCGLFLVLTHLIILANLTLGSRCAK